MTLICGIDDAGRGPVIGPMVLAGVLIEENEGAKLKKLGVKDSKQLTAQRREELYPEVLKLAKGYHIVHSEAHEIDEAILSGFDNLNWVEARHCVTIINQLKPDVVYIDCPSRNLQAFASWIRERLDNKEVTIVCEHRADINYPVVSAASILAKVTRDAKIEELKKKVGENFGSGYMGDPVTVEFLEKNWEKHPDIFRKSWESYQNVASQKGQKKLEEF